MCGGVRSTGPLVMEPTTTHIADTSRSTGRTETENKTINGVIRLALIIHPYQKITQSRDRPPSFPISDWCEKHVRFGLESLDGDCARWGVGKPVYVCTSLIWCCRVPSHVAMWMREKKIGSSAAEQPPPLPLGASVSAPRESCCSRCYCCC
jgi:hypothetical protein